MVSSVLVMSRAGAATLDEVQRQRLERVAEVEYVVVEEAPKPDQARDLLRGRHVLGATNLVLPVLDDVLLDAAGDLRTVVLYATGHDHLDLDLLARRGVAVSVLPHYATVAVAEHALAMVFSLATRIHLANDRSRGLIPSTVSLRGVELAGRTLGVIGLGRIGSRVARLAAGVGMHVVGCDIDPAARARATRDRIKVLDHATLAAVSDVVVLCASLTPGAPPVLDAALLARLPRGSFVVNVGRPALVDTAAVVTGLRTERLRGYGVDDVVLDPRRHADLIAQGRVVQTGHSAWWRDEVLKRGGEMFGAALVAAALGSPTDVVTAPVSQTAV